MLTLLPVEKKEQLSTPSRKAFLPGTLVVLGETDVVKKTMGNYWINELQNFCGVRRAGRVLRSSGTYCTVQFRFSLEVFLMDCGMLAPTVSPLKTADASISTISASFDGLLCTPKNSTPTEPCEVSEIITVSHSFPASCLKSLVEHRAGEIKYEIIKLLNGQRYREVIALVDMLIQAHVAIVVPPLAEKMTPCQLLYREARLVDEEVQQEQIAELYSARSTASLGLRSYRQSVEDALLGIAADKTSISCYVTLIEAHHAEGRIDLAAEVIERARKECTQAICDSDALFSGALVYHNVLRTFAPILHAAKCKLDVTLGPSSNLRPPRLTLHTTSTFVHNEVLVKEAPVLLCADRDAPHAQCFRCGYLLGKKQEMLAAISSSIIPHEAAVILAAKCRRLLPGRDLVPCDKDCGVQYCSQTCKAAAWDDLHRFDCRKAGKYRETFAVLEGELEGLEADRRKTPAQALFLHLIALFLKETELVAQCPLEQLCFAVDGDAICREALSRVGRRIGMPTVGQYQVEGGSIPSICEAAIRALSTFFPIASGFGVIYEAITRLYLHTLRHHVSVQKCPLTSVVGSTDVMPAHLQLVWREICSKFTAKSIGLYPIVGAAKGDLNSQLPDGMPTKAVTAISASEDFSLHSLSEPEAGASCMAAVERRGPTAFWLHDETTNVLLDCDVSADGGIVALRCQPAELPAGSVVCL